MNERAWAAPGFLLLLLLAQAGVGWAATYTLPGGPLPSGCTASGAVVTCGVVTLGNNDVVVISAPPVAVTWNISGLNANANNIRINANQDAGYLSIVSSGNIEIENNVVINASIEAVGNIEIKNNGSLTGDITGQANVSIGNNATIYGDISAGGDVTIGSNAVVVGNIYAVGDIDIGANAEISGVCLETNVSVPVVQCNTTISSLHHLRIEHDGEGLTCMPESVTVRACADATCSSEYTVGNVTVTLSPSGWVGGDTINFMGGHTIVQLKRTTAGSVTLGASNINPAPTNGVRCFIGGVENCTLNFADVGFIFSAAANGPEVEVGPQIAGTAFGPYWLRAIKTNDKTKACESALSAPQTVNFSYVCADPATCSSGNQMTIGASAVGASATPLSLSFDGNGNASLGNIDYLDVGKITLLATASVGGATLTGSLGGVGGSPFVVKPDHFDLSAISCSDGTANPGATDASGGKFCKAGDDFTVTVTARSSTGVATKNYGKETAQESVKLTHALVGGLGLTENGNLTGSFGAFTDGVASGSFQWDEVGIIRLTPSINDGDYLGAGDVAGTETGNVGRFYPHAFALSGALLGNRADLTTTGSMSSGSSSLTVLATTGTAVGRTLSIQGAGTGGAALVTTVVAIAGNVITLADAAVTTVTDTTVYSYCAACNFTYMSEPLFAGFTLTAHNLAGTTTGNYAGNFATLNPVTTALWPSTTLGTTGFSLGARNDSTELSTRLVPSAPNGTWAAGVANIAVNLTLVRPTTTTSDASWGPYAALNIGIAPRDADGVALATSVLNMDANGDSSNERVLLGQTQSRFGRLRLVNFYGSELLAPRVEYRAEYWDGARWTINALDSHTTIAAGNIATGGLTVGTVGALANGSGFITFGVAGAGSHDIAVNLNASGSDTSCNTTHGGTAASMSWLQGYWSAPGNCGGVAAWAQDPNARIRLGSPRAPYIYLRERY